MMCKKPFMVGAIPAGCGRCMPCRINRRRLWSHRIMLESLKHAKSSFVTLTYSDEHLPSSLSLQPKDCQDWLKRLREKIEPLKVRYFLVGEYGDLSQRPHYHLALFGLGPRDQEIVSDTWKMGHVFCGDLTHESAQYIAGYVTKKMTSKDDPRLNGRYPEFARMSLRPGLGATALNEIRLALETTGGAELLAREGDVPTVLRHGKTILPLGRYLRSKLRTLYGFKDPGTPQEVLWKVQTEMHQVLTDALKDPENRSLSLKHILLKKNRQKVLNLETRAKIYSKKGIL